MMNTSTGVPTKGEAQMPFSYDPHVRFQLRVFNDPPKKDEFERSPVWRFDAGTKFDNDRLATHVPERAEETPVGIECVYFSVAKIANKDIAAEPAKGE